MDDYIEQSKDVVVSKTEQSEDVVVSKEEEEVNLEWNDGDFCLFRPLKMSDISSGDIMSLGDNLIVIASSLKDDSEAKLLRLILALRVKYWTLQPLCGVVSSFHAGVTDPAQLYTCLIDTTGPSDKIEKPKYLLCCLSMRGTGLELFREELDSFANTLAPSLQNLPTPVTSDSNIFQQLKSWTSAVFYLSEIILKYHDSLPILLYAALINSVNISGDNAVTVQELNRFINSCSVDILMQTQKTQLIDIDSDFDRPTVTIRITGNSLTLSSQETNEFCKKWSKALLSQGVSEVDPFFLKRIIESYKLKIIQDMNALKRLIRDAERNYYTLYKCYTFLQATGNVDILLKCSLSEAKSQDESETKSVLIALQEYISKKRSHNDNQTSQPLIEL